MRKKLGKARLAVNLSRAFYFILKYIFLKLITLLSMDSIQFTVSWESHSKILSIK